MQLKAALEGYAGRQLVGQELLHAVLSKLYDSDNGDAAADLSLLHAAKEVQDDTVATLTQAVDAAEANAKKEARSRAKAEKEATELRAELKARSARRKQHKRALKKAAAAEKRAERASAALLEGRTKWAAEQTEMSKANQDLAEELLLAQRAAGKSGQDVLAQLAAERESGAVVRKELERVNAEVASERAALERCRKTLLLLQSRMDAMKLREPGQGGAGARTGKDGQGQARTGRDGQGQTRT